MAYSCDGCGACCRTFPVFASREDSRREPRIVREGVKLKPWLESEVWDYQLYPLPFLCACPFLDSEQRCTIYPSRPDVCREFEPGSEQCQQARKAEGRDPLPPGSELDVIILQNPDQEAAPSEMLSKEPVRIPAPIADNPD